METGKLPYETLVLVCTNERPDGERLSCAGPGRCGALLRQRLKDEAARRGLKGKVRVSATGCLDVCDDGPNVVIVPPSGGKIWFKKVSEADLPAILARAEEGT